LHRSVDRPVDRSEVLLRDGFQIEPHADPVLRAANQQLLVIAMSGEIPA
jgi:hypothetical protein